MSGVRGAARFVYLDPAGFFGLAFAFFFLSSKELKVQRRDISASMV